RADHSSLSLFFFFQAEDGIRDGHVTGVQTCALPICDVTPVDKLAGVLRGLADVVLETHPFDTKELDELVLVLGVLLAARADRYCGYHQRNNPSPSVTFVGVEEGPPSSYSFLRDFASARI